jgi:hypothetical protein
MPSAASLASRLARAAALASASACRIASASAYANASASRCAISSAVSGTMVSSPVEQSIMILVRVSVIFILPCCLGYGETEAPPEPDLMPYSDAVEYCIKLPALEVN